jgi:hypothetical protein
MPETAAASDAALGERLSAACDRFYEALFARAPGLDYESQRALQADVAIRAMTRLLGGLEAQFDPDMPELSKQRIVEIAERALASATIGAKSFTGAAAVGEQVRDV